MEEHIHMNEAGDKIENSEDHVVFSELSCNCRRTALQRKFALWRDPSRDQSGNQRSLLSDPCRITTAEKKEHLCSM